MVTAILIGLMGSELPAAPKKPPEFSEGIKAQDQAYWDKSARLLEKAAGQQPDDGALTRIYGSRFEPYLPFYFLGLARYKQGQCAEAIQKWEKSLQAGAVQRTDKYKLLLRYQEDCRHGLPSLRSVNSRSGEEIERAASGLGQ